MKVAVGWRREVGGREGGDSGGVGGGGGCGVVGWWGVRRYIRRS